jgi:hypothetical protein
LALIPWVQNQGFALFGRPYEDQALCDLAGKSEKAPGFIAGVTVDTTGPPWKIALSLVRQANGRRLSEASFEAVAENPGPTIERLAETLIQMMLAHDGVKRAPSPPWYELPPGQDASDYLLRLEQQLAVACMHFEFLKGAALHGERELLDGILQLCVRQPANLTVRMVLAQTLRQMKKVRPEILSEYREKVALLQRNHLLVGDAATLVAKAIAESLESLA